MMINVEDRAPSPGGKNFIDLQFTEITENIDEDSHEE